MYIYIYIYIYTYVYVDVNRWFLLSLCLVVHDSWSSQGPSWIMEILHGPCMACMHMHSYICMCMHAYLCIHACLYMRTYVCICMHAMQSCMDTHRGGHPTTTHHMGGAIRIYAAICSYLQLDAAMCSYVQLCAELKVCYTALPYGNISKRRVSLQPAGAVIQLNL